jgi:hypothetical protein
MHHDFFGDIRYDEADQFWMGWATLPLIAAFGEAGSGDEVEERRRREAMLPLVVNDPDGAGPRPPQVAAFRFLLDHEADVFRAARQALFESYQAYTTSWMSGFWCWLGRRLGVKPIESPEGLEANARFTGVEVAREHTGDTAFLLFAAYCDWEAEHGMMVVFHPDRPATWTTPDALELVSDGSED